MKFSIIIPVYNSVGFIKEAIASIESQTFKDYEVICIDDHSTDESLELLQSYQSSLFKVMSTPKNLRGPGCTRNVGMDIARGEYLLFLDSDDFYITGDALSLLASECDGTDLII